MGLFTPKMIQWLSKNVTGKKYIEIALLFNKKFNTQLTHGQIKDACKYRRIQTGCLGKKRMPIGTERVFNKAMGIVYVKISEKILPKLHTKVSCTRAGTWRQKHIIVWEKANGCMPKGYIIVFADGNRKHFNIENLLLVSKKEHQYMCRFRLHSNNPDITKTNLLITRHRLLIIDKIKKVTGNGRNVYKMEAQDGRA